MHFLTLQLSLSLLTLSYTAAKSFTEIGFEELEKHTHENGEPHIASGRQEMLENLINDFI